MSSDSWSLGERSLAYDPSLPVAGTDVSELQLLLADLGYSLTHDGIYGPATAGQVRRFQDHRRLTTDGVFGPLTMRELSRVIDRGTRPRQQGFLGARPS